MYCRECILPRLQFLHNCCQVVCHFWCFSVSIVIHNLCFILYVYVVIEFSLVLSFGTWIYFLSLFLPITVHNSKSVSLCRAISHFCNQVSLASCIYLYFCPRLIVLVYICVWLCSCVQPSDVYKSLLFTAAFGGLSVLLLSLCWTCLFKAKESSDSWLAEGNMQIVLFRASEEIQKSGIQVCSMTEWLTDWVFSSISKVLSLLCYPEKHIIICLKKRPLPPWCEWYSICNS